MSTGGDEVAVVHGNLLLIVDIKERRPPPVVPGSYADESVCGWIAGGAEVLLRSQAAPVSIRRVNLATGESSVAFTIAPPRLGRRGMYALAVSGRGDAYANSYGQELSRLYTLTTDGLKAADRLIG